jgi:tetratricopeptide (TPR) repeat protein
MKLRLPRLSDPPALPVLIFLLVSTVLVHSARLPTWAAASSSPRPMQTLYRIELQAVQSGWTSELAAAAGDLWQSIGDLPRALRCWEIAASLTEADAALLRRLAGAYLDLQRWPQAVITLDQLVGLLPGDAWAQFSLGLAQLAFNSSEAVDHLRLAAQSPDYRPVVDDLLAVLADNPDDLANLMTVAVVLGQNGLWPFAERVSLAASDATHVPEALAYAGLARDQQGKNGAAQIDAAAAAAPDSPQVRFLQGIHLRLHGDVLGGLDALLRAAALDPVNPAYAAEVSASYQTLGNWTEAENWLVLAVKLSGDDPRFQDLLTRFYEAIPGAGS